MASIFTDAVRTFKKGDLMSFDTGETETGFVCPDWAIAEYDLRECSIELCSDGNSAVLDNKLQVTIFIGTEEECREFIEQDTEVEPMSDYEKALFEDGVMEFFGMWTERLGLDSTRALVSGSLVGADCT